MLSDELYFTFIVLVPCFRQSSGVLWLGALFCSSLVPHMLLRLLSRHPQQCQFAALPAHCHSSARILADLDRRCNAVTIHGAVPHNHCCEHCILIGAVMGLWSCVHAWARQIVTWRLIGRACPSFAFKLWSRREAHTNCLSVSLGQLYQRSNSNAVGKARAHQARDNLRRLQCGSMLLSQSLWKLL